MIELDSEYLAKVKSILRQHLTHCEVYAFGSRVNDSSRKYSDLDLVLKAEHAIDWKTMDTLKDDFSFSDLPILVDLVDWHKLSEEFLSAIQAELVRFPLQD